MTTPPRRAQPIREPGPERWVAPEAGEIVRYESLELRVEPADVERLERSRNATSCLTGCVYLVAWSLVIAAFVSIAALVVAAPRGASDASLPAHPTAQHPALLGAPDTFPEVGAPQTAEGEIGEVLSSDRGWATYCAPTATKCKGWDSQFLGAVPSFSWGDDPYWVQVCRRDRPATCTHVLVVSYCACGDRRGIPTVIDLSVPAFRELARLGTGIVRVTVERVAGPGLTLPPTDVGP